MRPPQRIETEPGERCIRVSARGSPQPSVLTLRFTYSHVHLCVHHKPRHIHHPNTPHTPLTCVHIHADAHSYENSVICMSTHAHTHTHSKGLSCPASAAGQCPGIRPVKPAGLMDRGICWASVVLSHTSSSLHTNWRLP